MTEALDAVTDETQNAKAQFSGRVVIVCGVFSAILYGIILWLSQRFALGLNQQQRPLLEVLGLFVLAFIAYLIAQVFVLKTAPRKALMAVIVGSVVFRVLLLFSQPIQEVDLYRYIWDGAVSEAGVNPFRYSPQQVLQANDNDILDPELARLVAKRDQSSGLHDVLKHVHFGHLSTPYPPTSQAVFALSAVFTPASASEWQHLLIMKAFVVAFDLGVLLIMILLLRETGRHPGWALAYGWCPLLIKEFGNSGHLDSITVFFSMAAIYVFVRAIRLWQANRKSLGYQRAQQAAVLLALAVGGKFYPVVFAPVIAVVAWKTFGRWKTVQLGGLFTGLTFLICLPMMTPYIGNAANGSEQDTQFSSSASAKVDTNVPEPGIAAFVGRWEINDLLFTIVVENIKPNQDPVPWFVVTPNSWREKITQTLGDRPDLPRYRIPFFIARGITLLIWLGVLIGLMIRAARNPTIETLLACCFLSVTWFWLLCPTQNPWYWSWSLPLIPFVRRKSWFLMSGVLFLYYTRFWLKYHHKHELVFGTNYTGDQFFYFVVPWIEFLPVLLLLFVETFSVSVSESTEPAAPDA